jgi:hypothetical protein
MAVVRRTKPKVNLGVSYINGVHRTLVVLVRLSSPEHNTSIIAIRHTFPTSVGRESNFVKFQSRDSIANQRF